MSNSPLKRERYVAVFAWRQSAQTRNRSKLGQGCAELNGNGSRGTTR